MTNKNDSTQGKGNNHFSRIAEFLYNMFSQMMTHHIQVTLLNNRYDDAAHTGDRAQQ